MKRFITLITILVFTFQVKSQTNIVGYEYWFNNDFANKTSTTVSPVSQLNINANIPTTSLSTGIHSFNFRSWDDSSRYSSVISQFFYKINPTTAVNRDIVAYEYWFDNDYANVVTQAVSNQQQLNLNTIITTGSINSGIHSFNIRFKDNTGMWSSVSSQFFYKINPTTTVNRDIVAYEYWFDNDYANVVTQTVTNQQQLNLNTIIATGSINSGIHSFNIRFKDNTEMWSSVLSQFFYKVNPTTLTNRDIVAYEYWFDNNYANVVTQTVTNQQQLDLNTIIATGAINNGIHSFNIRFKDNTEMWSSVLSQFFYKIPEQVNLVSNKITTYRYWFDDDFAQVNTVTLTTPVQQLNLIDNLDLTQVAKGIHTIHFQFKDSLNMWSSVTSDSLEKKALPIANFNHTLSGDCDSTLVTFIDNSIDGDIYSWDFGDGQNSTESNPTHTYFNTGVYNVTLTVTDTLSGLDSTITNAVNVYMTSEATITEIACNSYTAPDGTIYNTSGTKTAIIPNSVSCDSVITINLTINEVDTSVTQDSYELTSNATGATYQWLDCNNGFSTMPGETNSVFVATSNGSYAVEVTQNNCVDTTACFDVTTVGIEAMENQQTITIYPNPSKGIFTIYSYFDNSVPIQIIDLLGKEVLSPTNIDNGVNTIDISHLNKGIYFIKIINLKETYVHRIVLN